MRIFFRWLLVTGHGIPFPYWWLLVTGHGMPVPYWWILVTGHETPDPNWWLLVTGHELVTSVVTPVINTYGARPITVQLCTHGGKWKHLYLWCLPNTSTTVNLHLRWTQLLIKNKALINKEQDKTKWRQSSAKYSGHSTSRAIPIWWYCTFMVLTQYKY